MVELSIILPVFNGGTYLKKNLQELYDFLKCHYDTFEIIAVDDGSTDNTSELLQSQQMAELRFIQLDRNYGKGYAVACGMKEAQGICCIFTDADLPYDLTAILYSTHLINDRGYHVVAGDRTLPGSNYLSDTGKFRAFASKVFSVIVRLGITGEMYDTQCGFKAFRGEIAHELFGMITLKDFSFDAEILYIVLRYNMEIRRIPVRYKATSGTTVRPFADGLRMFISLFRPPKNWRHGRYRNEKLEKLCRAYYWENFDSSAL